MSRDGSDSGDGGGSDGGGGGRASHGAEDSGGTDGGDASSVNRGCREGSGAVRPVKASMTAVERKEVARLWSLLAAEGATRPLGLRGVAQAPRWVGLRTRGNTLPLREADS